jgi:hypothetical protein
LYSKSKSKSPATLNINKWDKYKNKYNLNFGGRRAYATTSYIQDDSECESNYIMDTNNSIKINNDKIINDQMKVRKVIKKRVKEIEQEKKYKNEVFSKGYYSYLKNKFIFPLCEGNVNYLLEDDNLKDKFLEFINQLENKKIYSILFLLQFYKKGEQNIRIVMNSKIISKNSNIDFTLTDVRKSLKGKESTYNYANKDAEICIFYRE